MIQRFNENELEQLAEILKNDEVISVPTDTVYGVCARMNSEKAEQKLRDVKNRPATKAFPIMCKDEEQIKSIAYVSEKAEKIIRAFMPGPITIILKKKEEVPDYVNSGMETLAIRMATSNEIKKIIELVGSPLFMTSANQSGEKTCTTLDEIEVSCPLISGMLIGDTEFSRASTIVDITKNDAIILRDGPITLEEINKVLD